MPDPSGEPPHSTPVPPVGREVPPSPLAPAPRQHHPTGHPAPERRSSPPPPPGFKAALEWLQRYGNLDLDADDPSPGAHSSASRLSKDQRKFHRFDPEHPQASPENPRHMARSDETEAMPAPGIDGDLSGAGYPRGITAEQIAFMRRQGAENADPRLWIAVGMATIAVVLVAGAFLAAHSNFFKAFVATHGTKTPPQKAAVASSLPPALPSGVTDMLDRAMTAEAAADYPQAIDLLERAQTTTGHIYGLDYRLASLCYKANEMAKVLPLLDLSIAKGEEIPASYSLRGLLSNQSEGTDDDPSDLEKATRLEPFNARYYFVWGEALRKAGKPQLAVEQLQRALARSQEPDLSGIYALKLRLTQVELGQEDAFAAELNDRLKDSPPPVDWLLTAAALEMKRGAFPAAAEMLGKIRALIGEHATARQLHDPFFKRYASEGELARFFDVPVSP